MTTPTILIANDNPAMRLGIKEELYKSGIEKIVEAALYNEIPISVKRFQPDLIILGERLKEEFTLGLVYQLRDAFPEQKILILGPCHPEIIIWSFLKSGIKGYLVEEKAISDSVDAVTSVTNGEVWFSPTIMEMIIGRFNQIDDHFCLSQRELAIIQMLSKGQKEKEIARSLYLSERTIRYSLQSIYKKINVNTKIQAICWAATEGIL